MRKLMYTILVIDIVSSIIAFFALIFSNFLFALICMPIILLSLVPTIAIIENIDKIDELKEEINSLKHKIESKNTDKINNTSKEKNIEYKETARGTWECVKCKTVNKKGTDCCSNCKAPYSAWTNPTDDFVNKKKISKWVKF